jgi:hypothetical protein
MKIEEFEKELLTLKEKLVNHNLYKSIKTNKDISVFMEGHVFAVWDFMSLVKKLQQLLTCTKVPWIPSKNPESGRLINDIVLGEETDFTKNGKVLSHFEMYVKAMKNVGANTNQIEEFINNLNYELNITDYIDKSNIPMFAKNFMNFTFKTIQSEKDHIIAAVFTFGREDLIPDMFIEIVKNISSNEEVDLKDLIYYLERHIEVDAEDHGPMALKMIKHLCGNDQIKWKEALDYSKTALNQRIKLWNAIEKTLN